MMTPEEVEAEYQAGRLTEEEYQTALAIALAAGIAVGAVVDDYDDYDATLPVITVHGDNPVTIELGTTYVDQGATASDSNDGSVPVTTDGNVNTNAVGTYTINYSATDLSGNTGSATRTVNVVDTTAPVVTLNGDDYITIELGDTYIEQGATASDHAGSVDVTTTGNVDTDTVGTYTILIVQLTHLEIQGQ